MDHLGGTNQDDEKQNREWQGIPRPLPEESAPLSLAQQLAARKEAQSLIADFSGEKNGQPTSKEGRNRLKAFAEKAANLALSFVPGGELGKLIIERVKDPERLSKMTKKEILNLAGSLALDFMPTGKALRLAGNAGKPVLKKLQKKISGLLAKKLNTSALKKGAQEAGSWSTGRLWSRWFGKKAAKEGARGAGKFILSGLSKSEARTLVKSMGLPQAQLSAVNKAIKRMTSTSVSKVTQNGSDVVLQTFRHGRDGYQVIEVTVRTNGLKTVIQKAYDSAGKLVHYHPK